MNNLITVKFNIIDFETTYYILFQNTTCDPKTEFRCDSGKCILRGSICNTEKDCPTGYEDEEETLCYVCTNTFYSK